MSKRKLGSKKASSIVKRTKATVNQKSKTKPLEFRKFPTEIRDAIYQQCVPSFAVNIEQPGAPGPFRGLLRSCRQIQAEFGHFWFENNVFLWNVRSVRRRGPKGAHEISAVKVWSS